MYVSYMLRYMKKYQAAVWKFRSVYVLEDEPGKLHIKRREPNILFISLQVGSFFKLAIMTLLPVFESIQRY